MKTFLSIVFIWLFFVVLGLLFAKWEKQNKDNEKAQMKLHHCIQIISAMPYNTGSANADGYRCPDGIIYYITYEK